VQTCIVHLIRSSLEYASWRDRKQIVAAIRPVYKAATVEAAEAALAAFEASAWGKKYPTIGAAWRRAWERVIPLNYGYVRGSLNPAAQA
jgi:putative transposase